MKQRKISFKALLLVVCLLICLSACGEAEISMDLENASFESQADTSQAVSTNQVEESGNDQLVEHTHNYSAATCTSPQRCSCGQETGSPLGHSFSETSCVRCGAKNPNYKAPSKPVQHSHSYSSSVTTAANCGSDGVRTYICSCGHSYTETISKTGLHNWEYATCNKPDTCKDCGTTRGSKKEHNYVSYDGYKCRTCGQVDPTIQATLNSCSLQLPTLPKTISRYDYSDKIESKVEVTGISYQFEYYGDGKVTLIAKFSGKKVYDKRGTGQSDSCEIGWKLYDPNGNVFRGGTFRSPSVAVGETFSNQEEDLIYNFEASVPGKYRLEIMNVN